MRRDAGGAVDRHADVAGRSARATRRAIGHCLRGGAACSPAGADALGHHAGGVVTQRGKHRRRQGHVHVTTAAARASDAARPAADRARQRAAIRALAAARERIHARRVTTGCLDGNRQLGLPVQRNIDLPGIAASAAITRVAGTQARNVTAVKAAAGSCPTLQQSDDTRRR
ncbi:hypothetical protein D3C87_1539890 [compost metagenome]